MRINIDDLSNEIDFQTSRSSGPGGQNVNKVNTKVTLRLDITGSQVLNEKEQKVILKKLKSRINKNGVLILSEDSSRSQVKNKELVIKKLDKHLRKAFVKKKKRIKTKPGKAAKEKRLKEKKKQSQKKKLRREKF